jgi:extradiol dioxygenase
MSITQLGYIGLRVRDVDAWERFARDLLGMQVWDRGPDRGLYLRMDERHHRIRVSAGETDELMYLGWQVLDERDLAQTVENLSAAGVEVEMGSEQDARDRAVLGFARFVDPNGFPSELFYGPRVDQRPFKPGRAMSGFVTGAQGLGHVFLYVADIEKSAAFYRDHLGFRISDYIFWKEARMDIVFMRANPRHHSVGFAHHPDVVPGQIEHFLVETRSFDDVGLAYDLCEEMGVPIAMSLGKHTNDHMTSFYAVNPSGFWVEYGYGGRTVSDEQDWAVQLHTNGHVWGHRLIHAADRSPVKTFERPPAAD